MQHDVLDKDCDPLKAQGVKYLQSLKPSGSAATASAPAPAAAAAPAAAGAGTPSPIDFETKVDVKSKKGGPPRKETLKIVRGARLCQLFSVAKSDAVNFLVFRGCD